MPYLPPTLNELKTNIQSFVESKTSQKVPTYERSFKRVLCNAISLIHYPIYHFITNQRKQCFAISADEENLKSIHAPEEGVEINGSTICEVEIELVVTGNADVPVSTSFENEATGLFYFPKINNSVTTESYTIELIAEKSGSEYYLEVGDVLKNNGNIEGVGESCTVSNVIVYPTDEEDIEELRRRIIQKRSGTVGGGNAYDYRTLCESVSGVYRAFVFSGRPDDPENSKPGDRSIFIECDYLYGTDGIASESILSSVQEAIRVSEYGTSNESLGLTEDTLFVSSTSHVLFDIHIDSLSCAVSIESKLKDKINVVATDYLRSLAPYCYGVDPEYERKDNVSSITISEEIGRLLRQYSATAASIEVTEVGVGVVTNRILIGGETARLNGVTYGAPD